MREAHAHGAASVASQLLAFMKEPARYRAGYLHGRDALPDGATVFRLAHGKQGEPRVRDAALAFIRQVCLWEGATHYQLLCAAPNAARDTLKENYHLLMALIHPDRQEPGAQPWPADCAPRVNRAYAVLGDEQARRDYDAGLRLLATGEMFTPDTAAQAHAPARKKRRQPASLRFAKALVVVVAVAGTLLLLEVWVSDFSGNYSAFHGAFKGRTRGVGADTEAPRFLGLWRAPAPEAPAPEPVQLPPAKAQPLLPLPPPPHSRGVVKLPDPPPAHELQNAASVSVAQAPRPAAIPAAVAPPREATTSSRDAAATQAIEVMVARLVGAYEAGETEKLIELLDAGETGFWRTARIRQAYGDFFRATRQRKLRLDNLAWRTHEGSAHAKGEATLVAEYFDTPGTTERKVDVEFDVALRGGEARITRLSLFPNTP